MTTFVWSVIYRHCSALFLSPLIHNDFILCFRTLTKCKWIAGQVVPQQTIIVQFEMEEAFVVRITEKAQVALQEVGEEDHDDFIIVDAKFPPLADTPGFKG